MRRARRSAVGLFVLSLVAGACSLNIAGTQIAGAPPSYVIKADFPTTIGLYPGSFVRQLGIDVGSVSKVKNEGDHVLVTMKIQNKYHLAPDANAILVGDSVLGERYVQFAPPYISGPTMAAGTTIADTPTLKRVFVPVETDAVLRSLNTVLRGINPTDIKQFTVNLSTLLAGQGAKLNDLIANAAGTVQLLADKGNALGQLSGTLAKLTGQLDTKDTALANLIRDYDLLAQTLAQDRGQIDATITQLTNLTTQGAGLLAPNLTAVQNDVAALTTVGQTLDRNIPAIDIGVNYADRLFSAAGRAYDPLHNWLPLNAEANPTAITAVLGGSVRDALASLCRRLGVKVPSLASTLAACGNPASGFFDPIVGLLPSILSKLPGQTAPAGASSSSTTATSATDAFAKGLAAIPGLSADQRQSLTGGPTQPAAVQPAGPPGAAAVASLSATPIDSTVASAAVPVHHRHRGFFASLFGWVGDIL